MYCPLLNHTQQQKQYTVNICNNPIAFRLRKYRLFPPRMRLKIKQVHPSPETLQQQQQQQQQYHHQENHVDQQQIMKKEIVDDEAEDDRGSGSQWLKSEEREQPSLSKSGDTNTIDNTSNHNQIDSLPNSSDVQNLGKRKRKPRELLDQISPIIVRRRRKRSTDSKSAHQATPNSEGKYISKQEKAEDGSSIPVQKSPTLIRAEELQTSLGDEYPTFVKLLGRSHIGSCFRMGLPVPFCKSHLPKKEAVIILENENGEQFDIRYIAEKTGLGAGWRRFVSTHKLVEGDVMTFQLIGPTTFKVYITRANDMTEVDGALSLLNLEALTKQSDADGTVAVNKKKRHRQKSLPLTLVHNKKQELELPKSTMQPLARLEEYSGNDSEEVASEVMESSKASEDSLRFRDVKSFEDFHIQVNGVCIDSDLPEHIRRKYYELCCSKNAFIHERFLPGLHCKLAAGMILEAVNTADSIRSCKITTSKKEFEKWEKSLRSFELLGMNVGFIRDRLRWLLSLAFDSEEAIEAKKYWEVKNTRARMKDEIEDLEVKLAELKEDSKKYDDEIEGLKPKAESYEVMFQEEVNAPW